MVLDMKNYCVSLLVQCDVKQINKTNTNPKTYLIHRSYKYSAIKLKEINMGSRLTLKNNIESEFNNKWKYITDLENMAVLTGKIL